MDLSFLKRKVFQVDGVTLTVTGALVVAIVAYFLIWRARK